jgi:uncharacterized membrane protein YccC
MVSLFVVAMVMPEVILMPRGQLLDWLSVLLRSAVSIVILVFCWLLYRTLTWQKQARRADGISPAGVGIA